MSITNIDDSGDTSLNIIRETFLANRSSSRREIPLRHYLRTTLFDREDAISFDRVRLGRARFTQQAGETYLSIS